MADETLRRNLETAFDPGPDFPDRLLLSRTMAYLNAQAARPRQGSRWKAARPWRLSWLRPGLRPVAILMVVVVAVAASAAILTARLLSSRFAPAHLTQPTGSCSSGALLHMVNATTGWQGDLDNTDFFGGPYRTVDGGLSWRAVQVPRTGSKSYTGSTSCFLDAEHAWVTVNVGGQVFVYRTIDGGRTWQHGQTVRGGTFVTQFVRLEFIDQDHGWLLVDTGGDTISNTRAIYSTTDGGVNWSQVASAAVKDLSPLGTMGVWCSESGMTFVDVNTGWLTWDCRQQKSPSLPVATGPVVAVTRDGGHTWVPVALPTFTPRGAVCGVEPPTFTAVRGVLPVTCDGAGRSAVFRTEDGGRTWTFFPQPADVEVTLQYFLDADNGWVFSRNARTNLAGSSPTDLYRTSDGGRDWVLVTRGLFPGHTMSAVQFLDLSNGFAIYDHSTLVNTADGGHTWSLIPGLSQ
ncbi:MAG TPA: hypothetical protein VF956_10375 [Candidatus Dormibacteraeota bacterium]